MRYAALIVPLVALLALACKGGGGPASTPTAAPASPTPTATAAPAATPTTAPVAQRIAYVDGEGAIWLVAADASGRKKLIEANRCPHAQLSWSPAGDRLACSGIRASTVVLREQQPEPVFMENTVVVIVDTEGRVLKEIEYAATFTWSPTGDHLLYGVKSPASPQPEPPADPVITTTYYIANTDGDVIGQIGHSGVWSPEGQPLAYVGDSGEVILYDVATGEQRSIDLGIAIDSVRWILGGKAMLVTSNVRDCGIICLEDVSLLDLDSGQLTPIPELSVTELEGCAPQSWPSPDGSKALFFDERAPDGGCVMAIMDFATLHVTPLQGAAIGYPSEGIPSPHVAFSADGSQIYWADVPSPPPEPGATPSATIYRAQSDGSGLTEIATLPGLLVWFSPDLTKVAYIETAAVVTLWVADIDGSNAILIGPAIMPCCTTFPWQPRL